MSSARDNSILLAVGLLGVFILGNILSSSGLFAVLFGIASSVLVLYLLWRAVQALERIADALETSSDDGDPDT